MTSETVVEASSPIVASDTESGGTGTPVGNISHVRFANSSTSSEENSKDGTEEHKAEAADTSRPTGVNSPGDISTMFPNLGDNVTVRDKNNQELPSGFSPQGMSGIGLNETAISSSGESYVARFNVGTHPLPFIFLAVSQTLKVLGASGPLLTFQNKEAIWAEWDNSLGWTSWEALIEEHDAPGFEDRMWGFLPILFSAIPLHMNHPVPFAMVWAFKEVIKVLVDAVSNIETLGVEPQDIDMFARASFRNSWVNFFDQCKIFIGGELEDYLKSTSDGDSISTQEWILVSTSPLRRLIENWHKNDHSPELLKGLRNDWNESKRAVNLENPTLRPPNNKTHCHGYWESNGGKPVWKDYRPYLDYAHLPRNVSYELDHWVGRWLPNKEYVAKGDDGKVTIFGTNHQYYQKPPELNMATVTKPSSPTSSPLSAGEVGNQATMEDTPGTVPPDPQDMTPNKLSTGDLNDATVTGDNTENSGGLLTGHQLLPPHRLSYDTRPAIRPSRYSSSSMFTASGSGGNFYGQGSNPGEGPGRRGAPFGENTGPRNYGMPTGSNRGNSGFSTAGNQGTAPSGPSANQTHQGNTAPPQATSANQNPGTYAPVGTSSTSSGHHQGGNSGSGSGLSGSAGGNSGGPYGGPGPFGGHQGGGPPGGPPGGPYGGPHGGGPPGGNPHRWGPGNTPGGNPYSGGPPPPPPPPPPPGYGGTSSGGGRSSSYKTKFSVKDYKEYKNVADFPIWLAHTTNAMRAQGIGELLNPNYTPTTPAETAEFWEKQHSMYFVLSTKVLTPTGKRIVKREEYTANAQLVLYNLIAEGRTSTKAILTGRDLFNKIATSSYSPAGTVTAVEYLAEWERKVEMYNEQQLDPDAQLRGLMLKNMLQNAVSHVPFLRDVASREQESIIRGYHPYSYEDYKALLESNATTYDESKVGKRSVNKLNVVLDDSDDEEEQEFAIHFTKGKVLGSTMNKETWNSLDKEEQALWDKLKDTTKRKILQYAKDRATKKEKEAKVNVVTLEDEEASSSSEEPDTPNKDQEKSDGGEETLQVMKTAIIKSILEEAKAEAHPGDVRRMMGKKTAKVKFTQRVKDEDLATCEGESDFEAVNALIDAYWEDDSQEDFHRGD
jgi:hypothetical protein